MSEGPDKPIDLATFITTLTKEWEHYHLQDDDLWESWKENFGGYTEDDFKIPTNTTDIRKLRELLKKQRVWVTSESCVYSYANTMLSPCMTLFEIGP